MRRFVAAYYPGIILFVFFLILSLYIYQDYGMGWDEPAQRSTGRISYNYVNNVNRDLLTYDDRQYGVFVELPLIYLEKGLQLTDTRDIFQMRHIVAHIFFLVGAFFFYVLTYRLFRDKLLTCLGFLMLVLSPRLYAHSYFNTKDVPFLCLLIITLAVCEAAFKRDKNWLFAMLGIACGLATGTRVMGIMVTGFIAGLLALDLFNNVKQKERMKQVIYHFASFIISFCLSMYAVWPYLWPSPLVNLIGAYHRMSHFIWHGSVLFKGMIIPGTQLPWTYFPTWFSITIPEMWLIAGCGGIVLLLFRFARSPLTYLKNTGERNFLLYVACFFAPVSLVIILHSVIYDDWRHLYFVYPPFLLLAIYFIQNTGRLKIFLLAACVVQLGITGCFMVKNHQYEQVYFNNFVSHKNDFLKENFEMDYWGLGFKDALEYISKTDHSSHIKVAGGIPLASEPLINNIQMLKKEDRIKFEKTSPEQADYYITNFREHLSLPYRNPVFEKKILNSTVLAVYKLH